MNSAVPNPSIDMAVEFAERERARANELRDQLRLANNALRRADKERSELRQLLAAAQAQLHASVGALLAHDAATLGATPQGDPAGPQGRPLGFRPPGSDGHAAASTKGVQDGAV